MSHFSTVSVFSCVGWAAYIFCVCVVLGRGGVGRSRAGRGGWGVGPDNYKRCSWTPALRRPCGFVHCLPFYELLFTALCAMYWYLQHFSLVDCKQG